MYDGALIDGVVRIDDLRSGKAEERVNGNENDADGVVMNGASPLKIMICGEGERGSDEPFPKRGEGAVIWLMD